jgi:NTP pyrophosphatase (non-canonical NTP hydrolase)
MRLRRKPSETDAVQWFPGDDVPGVFTEPQPDMPIEMQKQLSDGYEQGELHMLDCAAVKTINGQYALLMAGDWVFPEIDGKSYYPVKPAVVAELYEFIPDGEEPIENPLLELVALQGEVGYKLGELNLVALLGIFGEVGEVLDEVAIAFFKRRSLVDETFIHSILQAKEAAQQIDNWKKDIRDRKYAPNIEVTIDEDKFDRELADLLYYAVALSVIRGKPLDYYFTLSVRKVQERKRQKDITHANVENSSVLSNVIKG